MARLAVLLLCFAGSSASSLAASDSFVGTWAAGGEAGMSATVISWDGSQSTSKCRTTYEVIDRTQGHHPSADEGWPSSAVVSDATYTTVKVRLNHAKCLGSVAYLRFAAASGTGDHLMSSFMTTWTSWQLGLGSIESDDSHSHSHHRLKQKLGN
jgi:hypothetical protein